MADMGKRILALAVALGLSGPFAVPAQAQIDDWSLEQRLFQGLLTGLGILERERPPIDYRERAPLVLPPNTNLPAPQESASSRNPAWPNDPDAMRARRAAREANEPILRLDPDRRFSNEEMRSQSFGGLFGGGEVDVTRRGRAPDDYRALPAHEMGITPIWGQVGALFGGRNTDNQIIPFTGEPPRRRLVEPPPGFRTPSPDAPFGPLGRRPNDPQAVYNRGPSGQDPAGNR